MEFVVRHLLSLSVFDHVFHEGLVMTVVFAITLESVCLWSLLNANFRMFGSFNPSSFSAREFHSDGYSSTGRFTLKCSRIFSQETRAYFFP